MSKLLSYLSFLIMLPIELEHWYWTAFSSLTRLFSASLSNFVMCEHSSYSDPKQYENPYMMV